ncbi:MAG: hypothetical protein AAGI07_11465 [Bacteroidota bacterium]
MLVKLLLIGNLMVTGFLVGLIWFVQIVHYPIFAKVGKDAFPAFHHQHVQDTGKVVALPMLLELGFSILVLVFAGDSIPIWQNVLAFVLVLIVWLQTFFYFVPLHGKLGEVLNIQMVQQLVNANTWRTFFWTVRFLIVGWIVFNFFK